MPEYHTPCFTIQNSRPCRAESGRHIRTQLRCYEPRGAMSCGSPMPRGEQIAKPAERGTRSAGFLLCANPGGDMRDRLPALLLLALGALLAACQDTERSLAPKVDGPQFSLSAAEGLRGTIAFHSNRDGDFDIYVMNADGSRVTQVTRNTINEFDPIWSPNGQQIAFGRISGCCAAAVVVINADGSGERVLAENGFPGAWSPDGRHIAFSRSGDVYVMNVDGSGVTQLTHDGTASPTTRSAAASSNSPTTLPPTSATARAGRPTAGGSCSAAPATAASWMT